MEEHPEGVTMANGWPVKTHEEVLAEQLADDEFRREWERLSLARAVALEVMAYRADEGISQRELAARLGLRQPNVARLEAAEHVPSHEMLARLANLLDMEFTISIVPGDREPTRLTKAGRDRVVGSYTTNAGTIRLAAG